MNIIALRGFVGQNGKPVSIGDKLLVSDEFAKQLIKAGKAEEFIEPVKIEPVKKSKKTSENSTQKSNHVADDINAKSNNQIPNEDNVHDEDNISVDTADNDIDDEDNVTDVNETSDETQSDIKNNGIIIQKNTAGKK